MFLIKKDFSGKDRFLMEIGEGKVIVGKWYGRMLRIRFKNMGMVRVVRFKMGFRKGSVVDSV